ncbi:hypothetical protein [Streptomyces sp. NPDC096132]|uniref:hypothetical protein n=1 Tax=Streptomyces sp. NPDC096132 TaxID=3366075 RepID=UPI0037F70475
MHWHCARGCGAEGTKRYPTAQDAARYAQAFDREDQADMGRRAPLGLLPLRLLRAWRLRRREEAGGEPRAESPPP